MHDSSRDLVLAGTQQSAELKLALDQVRYTFLLYWYARYVCVYAVFTFSPVKFHAHTFIGVCVDSITFKYVSHLNIDVVCESFVCPFAFLLIRVCFNILHILLGKRCFFRFASTLVGSTSTSIYIVRPFLPYMITSLLINHLLVKSSVCTCKTFIHKFNRSH